MNAGSVCSLAHECRARSHNLREPQRGFTKGAHQPQTVLPADLSHIGTDGSTECRLLNSFLMDTSLRVPPQPPNTPVCCGMPRLSGISLHSSPADSGFYFISSQSPVKKKNKKKTLNNPANKRLKRVSKS